MPIGRHGAPVAVSTHWSRMLGQRLLRQAFKRPALRRYSMTSRLTPVRMTTYPFERVWHHGRGINFAAASDRTLNASNIPRSLHVAAEQASGSDKIPPVFGQDLETSDDDTSSFTTAPELEYDRGNAPSAVLEPETVPTLGIAFPKPPKTQLEYNICEEAFSAARDAPLGSTASYWSHKMYRGPLGDDGKPRNVTVHYCKSKHTMERTCQYFKDEKVLGFDMEWFPNATKASGPRLNCSLLQLASQSRIALFHVSLFPDKDEDDLLTPTFRRIMEDPEISKVGVNIKGDCTRMRTHLGLGTRGIFELSHMYRLVKFSSTGEFDLITKKLVPLGKQVEECLGLPLFKGYDVRGSNWSKSLNMRQADYSAADAYAGLQLYYVLDEQRQAMHPTPPRPYHAELEQPIRLARAAASTEEDSAPIPVDAEVAQETEITAGLLARNPSLDPAIGMTVDVENEILSKQP